MNKRLKYIALGCLTMVLGSSVMATKEGVGGADWKAQMRTMLTDVLVLFPLVFDDAKFKDPKGATIIQKSLNSLATHASGLKEHTSRVQPIDGLKIDPSFPFVAEAFEREVVMAQSAFSETGNSRNRSQIYLRSAISKCMMCHTQSPIGSELKIYQFENQFVSLSSSDRLMALTATRQFDTALKQFDQIVHDAKLTKPDPSTFDRNAKATLAIAVRAKNDPLKSLAVINQVISSGAGSSGLQKDATGWKKSVLEWQEEGRVATKSDQALFNEAKRLSTVEHLKKSEAEIYENTDVMLLRASSRLHDLLSSYPKSSLRAESYLLLASIYQSIPGFAIWDVGDEYLGACIKENPHSEMGERCFKEYDDSITLGYTGSSGTHLPGSVIKQLQKLQLLARRNVNKK